VTHVICGPEPAVPCWLIRWEVKPAEHLIPWRTVMLNLRSRRLAPRILRALPSRWCP